MKGGKREPITLCRDARPAGHWRPNQTCIAVGAVCKCFLIPAAPRHRGKNQGGGSPGGEGHSKPENREAEGGINKKNPRGNFGEHSRGQSGHPSEKANR